MDALSSMHTFLRSRPSSFNSLSHAIEWSVRSGQTKNTESARVSMPAQLKDKETGKCAIHLIGKTEEKNTTQMVLPTNAAVIPEEEEETGSEPKVSKLEEIKSKLTWRIDLAASEPHWRGWFEGLSQKFLSVPAAKLLLLAGVDRLDRDLTVGQMQGKFQMQVLPQAGHAVHEDVPDKVADVLATFLVRNKFAESMDDFQRTFPAC